MYHYVCTSYLLAGLELQSNLFFTLCSVSKLFFLIFAVLAVHRAGRVTRVRAWRPRNRGSLPGTDNNCSFLKRSDRLWDPTLLNGYCGIFGQDWSGLGVQLTTDYKLVLSKESVELCLHFCICFHGVRRDNVTFITADLISLASEHLRRFPGATER